MFSMRGLIELGKALARFVVVALVATVLLWKQFHSFSGLGAEPTRAAIGHALSLVGTALIALGGALAAIAIVDVPLAHLAVPQVAAHEPRRRFATSTRTPRAVPEIKSRVRRVQQAMARKRMMQEVPKADVVITNPTHYAVALRYDEPRMRAPVVVAKGRDLIALRIREIAVEHKVAAGRGAAAGAGAARRLRAGRRDSGAAVCRGRQDPGVRLPAAHRTRRGAAGAAAAAHRDARRVSGAPICVTQVALGRRF